MAFEEVGVRAVVEGVGKFRSDAASVADAEANIGRQAQKASGQTESFGRSLNTLGTRMQEQGRQAVLLGAGLAAPGIAALGMAKNFETALTRLSTVSGIAAEDVGALRDGILEISSQTAQGPQELAEALAIITSTGIKGAAALDILRASAKLSAIGLGETAVVARTVTAAVTAFGEQGLTASHAADVLFATVREGGAEVDEVAGALGRVVGIAAQVGLTFEDVGAFIATFTRLGISADEAVTSLRGTLAVMLDPSKEAAETLASVGLSMSDIKQVAIDDGLVAALQLLLTTFEGNTEALADVIPNVRALSGVLGTAGSQSEQFTAINEALKNSMGDTDAAFEQTSQTSAFKLEQAMANLQAALIELGAVGLPVINAFLQPITDMVAAFAGLPPPIQATLLAVTVVGGSLLVLGGTLSIVAGSVLRLITILPTLAAAFTTASVAITANPVALGLFVIAAGVAVGASVLLGKNLTDLASKNNEAAAATDALTIAQQKNADQIAGDVEGNQSRIRIIQNEIASIRERLATLPLTARQVAELRAREKELRDELVDQNEALKDNAEAHDIAQTAKDASAAQIQEAITNQEKVVAGLEHEKNVAQELARQTLNEATPARREAAQRVKELEKAIDGETGSLNRLKAALQVSNEVTKQMGPAGEAGASGIDAVGDAARDNIKELSTLTVEAAAATAAIEIMAGFEAARGKGLPAFAAAIGNMGRIIDQTIQRVKQAEGVKDFIRQITDEIATASGVQSKAQEAAARAGASAATAANKEAEDAARDAEQAAEDALRAAEQAAEQASRIYAEAAQNAARLAQETADLAARLAREAEQARAQIRQNEIAALDQLGNLVMTALRRQADAQLRVQVAAIDSQRTALRKSVTANIDSLNSQRDAAIAAAEDARDRQVAAIERTRDAAVAAAEAERDARLRTLQEQTDARVAALERELGVIDQQRDAEERQEILRRIALAFDIDDRRKAEADLRDFDRRQREKAIRTQIDQIQDASKKQEDIINDQADAAVDTAEDSADRQIDAAKRTADAKIDAAKRASDAAIESANQELDNSLAALDAQETAARDAYAAITDDWALQSKARELILQDEQGQIGKLLDAFVPEWRAAGLSFGQALIEGLRDSNVGKFVQQTLSAVPNPVTGKSPAQEARESEITQLQAQGERLKAGGAPAPALELIAAEILKRGGTPTFLVTQASERNAQIKAIQDQGKQLKSGGAPEVALELLRQQLINLGAVPEFRTGMDMGMVRRPILAALDPGEIVMNTDQQRMFGGNRGTVFEAGAFSGMFAGATFAGNADDNARAIRAEFEALFADVGRGAYRAGF